jgi:hypothetical protein
VLDQPANSLRKSYRIRLSISPSLYTLPQLVRDP